MSASSLPLVSISIVCYKHERFVRESVRSALAQTYENVEIVLSDDRSPDRTFELACDEANRYSGPKRISLHRNARNLGIIENYNATWSRCSGDIIVVQCGDDRSVPGRVSSIVSALSSDSGVDYVCSDIEAIDENGRFAHESARSWIDWPKSYSVDAFVDSGAWGGFLGCSAAFRSAVFRKYGPMRSDVLAEDCIMPFRGALEGGVRFLPERLLEYRVHPSMFSARKFDSTTREDRLYFAKGRYGNIQEWIRCLEFSGKATPLLKRKLNAFLQLREFDVKCFGSTPVKCGFLALKAMAHGSPLRSTLGALRRHLQAVEDTPDPFASNHYTQ